MADPHLNLFYAYGGRDRDGNLIEDNLTRAFIQAIRMLSDERRDEFLKRLFACDKELMEHHYGPAYVALQGNIPDNRDPRVRKTTPKYAVERIVTISTSTRDPEDGVNSPCEEKIDRRPDAWIFDRDGAQYCLLLECKSREYPVNLDQIRGHAKWFGRKDWEEEKLGWKDMKTRESGLRLLALTWYDVLKAMDEVFPELLDARRSTVKTENRLNDQEKWVLADLKVFLGYYGYRLFRGFRFAELGIRPPWRLFHK